MSNKKGQKFGSDPKSTMSVNGKASGAPAIVAPPANAWSQPLRPKPTNPPPPGMTGKGGKNQNSSGGNNSNNSNATNSAQVQNALRERFIGLSLNMVGQKVVVTQTNGAIFEGIFHTCSPFPNLPAETKNKYVIKACKVIKPPEDGQDAANETQALDQSTVIISTDKVACVTCKSMRIDTLAASSNGGSHQQQKAADMFRTDTQISGGRVGKDRDLVAAGSAWTSAASGNSRADALMGALGDDKADARRKPFNSAPNSGSIGEWDQFRANKELFNVKGNYDENLYTTELDKSQMDKKKLAEAERLAREIENTPSGNVHVAQERGHILQGDFDEEDLYSGVLKAGSAKPAAAPKTKGLDAAAQNKEVKQAKQKPLVTAPKKMNYAAAAAKADAGKKIAPPGFSAKSGQTKVSTPEKQPEKDVAKVTPDEKQQPANNESSAKQTDNSKQEENGVKPEPAPAAVELAENKAKEKSKEIAKEAAVAEASSTNTEAAKDKLEEAPKTTSKLNANAKEFTLNPSARTFTPGGGSSGNGMGAPDAHFMDPNAAMHGQMTHMHPHYMHAGPIGQPGMMHMMNPQFRYPNMYGMDQQHMPHMQPQQPQHAQQMGSAHGSGAPSPVPGSEEGSSAHQTQQDADAQSQSSAPSQSQQQQHHHHQQGMLHQQQQVPMPYGVPPPGAYYGGGMMHPRGPGGPHPGYHPQFVGGPQQIPVGPGGAPYRMYPMQGNMTPNVQLRGPGGPYYGAPVAPVPYPPGAYVGPGMIEDDQNVRGGRGAARGGRPGRRGGRGRGVRGGRVYNNYQQQSGRGQGEQNPNGAPQSADEWIEDETGGTAGDTQTMEAPAAQATGRAQSEEQSSGKQ